MAAATGVSVAQIYAEAEPFDIVEDDDGAAD
jgi:hypothetical protein